MLRRDSSTSTMSRAYAQSYTCIHFPTLFSLVLILCCWTRSLLDTNLERDYNIIVHSESIRLKTLAKVLASAAGCLFELRSQAQTPTERISPRTYEA